MKIKSLDSIDEIVDDIMKNTQAEDIDQIRLSKSKEDFIGMCHHGFGTWIRNHYGLWHTSKLTENWRLYPELHDIRDGVDHSKDHPDMVSSLVLEAVWERVHRV